MTTKQFGNEIKRLRKKQKITQIKLAKNCGFRGSHVISRIEKGDYRVLKNILKLIDTMGYEIVFKHKQF